MREIKFRVWDKEEKIMLLPENSSFYLCNEYGVVSFPIIVPINYNMPFGEGKERYVLMQFIGTHDSKRTEEYPEGQEIYKGDWVKCRDHYYPELPIFQGNVSYDNASFFIETDIGGRYRWMDYEVEVIGNIYENPELISE